MTQSKVEFRVCTSERSTGSKQEQLPSSNLATRNLNQIQNAKLGLPIDNSAPLMPEHFTFEDADWGQVHNESEFENWHSDEVQPSGESSWTTLSSSNIDQYIMEDEIDDQETEYVVGQYESQTNEMEEVEYESCDAMMVNSEVAEDNSAQYDDKYEDEINDIQVLKRT